MVLVVACSSAAGQRLMTSATTDDGARSRGAFHDGLSSWCSSTSRSDVGVPKTRRRSPRRRGLRFLDGRSRTSLDAGSLVLDAGDSDSAELRRRACGGSAAVRTERSGSALRVDFYGAPAGLATTGSSALPS